MCGEISQTTTSEIVEVANSAASRSKLQELLPVYFYSWQLQNLEAVIIHLLLNYFVLWRDGSEMRRDRQAFEEHIARLKNRVAELEENREPDLKEHSERLKGRVAELEKKLYDSRNEVNRVTAELEESEPEINRLMKQVQLRGLKAWLQYFYHVFDLIHGSDSGGFFKYLNKVL